MSVLRKMAAPLAALTVATLLFGALATSASAQVPPFTAYGSNQTAGAVVEAWINSVSCGSATVDADGNWLLQIGTDAPCSPAEGDTIAFTLDGAATSAAEIWKAGGAPSDVAGGSTLEPITGGPVVPPPADTGNAGFLAENSTSLASMLALGAFALLAVGGARAATRRR